MNSRVTNTNQEELNINLELSQLVTSGTTPTDVNGLIPIDTSTLPSFWGNMSKLDDLGLNITRVTSTNITYAQEKGSGRILLNKTELFFTSHFNGSTPVRVFAAVVKPHEDLSPQSAIGVVIIHGLGGSHRSALPLAERFAAQGMVTVSIDLPGHGGQSTGTSRVTAETLVQDNPHKSLIYHDVIATYRAITLLLSMPEVDPNKVVLTGGSFGGIMTFLTSALDKRVNAAIPLIATGDWETSALAGSFISALIPEDVSFTSPRVKKFIQNFDPLRYAAHINIPILMAIGTKDGFFVAETANRTFSIIPSNNKSLLLLPNVQHEIDERFITTAENWIQYYVNGDTDSEPPTLDMQFTKKPALHGEKLEIIMEISSNQPIMSVELAVREEIPGYSWFTLKMKKVGKNNFKAEWQAPIHGQNVQFFIIVMLESGAVYSSQLWQIHLESNLVLPFWLILASILIIPPGTFLYHNIRKFYLLTPEQRHKYIQYQGSIHFFPFILQLLLLFSLFIVPWYSVHFEGFGTLNWTLWQYLDFFFYFDVLPWIILLYAIMTTTGIILDPKKTIIITPIVPIVFFLLGLISIGFEGIGLGLYLALTAVILQAGIVGTLIYRTRQTAREENKKLSFQQKMEEKSPTLEDVQSLKNEANENVLQKEQR